MHPFLYTWFTALAVTVVMAVPKRMDGWLDGWMMGRWLPGTLPLQ